MKLPHELEDEYVKDVLCNNSLENLPDEERKPIELVNESSLSYGGSGKLSIEVYMSDRIVFIASGKAKLLWNTSFENIRPSAGLGIRFNL